MGPKGTTYHLGLVLDPLCAKSNEFEPEIKKKKSYCVSSKASLVALPLGYCSLKALN